MLRARLASSSQQTSRTALKLTVDMHSICYSGHQSSSWKLYFWPLHLKYELWKASNLDAQTQGIKSTDRLVGKNSPLAKVVDPRPPNCRLLQIRSFGSQEFRRLFTSLVTLSCSFLWHLATPGSKPCESGIWVMWKNALWIFHAPLGWSHKLLLSSHVQGKKQTN